MDTNHKRFHFLIKGSPAGRGGGGGGRSWRRGCGTGAKDENTIAFATFDLFQITFEEIHKTFSLARFQERWQYSTP